MPDGVYFYSGGTIVVPPSSISKVGLEGGPVTPLVTSPHPMRGFTLDATHVFYADSLGDLYRLPLTGGTSARIGGLIANPGTAAYKVNDDTTIFFGQSNYSRVGLWQVAKTGGVPTAYNGLAGSYVGIHGSELYYAAVDGNSVSTLHKVPKEGGAMTTLGGPYVVSDLAVDESGVYVAGDGVIQVPLSGGGMRRLVPTGAFRLALCPGHVYYLTLTSVGRVPKPGIPEPTGMSPLSAQVGSGDVSLTVTVKPGALVAGAAVHANGTALATTPGPGANELTAVLPASFLTTPGTVAITVANPGQPASASLAFTVTNPVPALAALNPSGVGEGAGSTLLTVSGTGFVAGGHLRFGTTELATVVSSSTFASATIPGALLAVTGTVGVTFVNPAPGGGISNELTFTIHDLPDNPTPVLTSYSPTEARVDSQGVIVEIQLQAGTVLGTTGVRVNGDTVPVDTSLAGAGIIRAFIPAPHFAYYPGSLDCLVINPAPGGGSAFFPFEVITTGNDRPVLSGISPTTVSAGAPDTTVTLTGTGFATTGGARVLLGDFPLELALTPSVVDATSATVVIPAARLVSPGAFHLRFSNPMPGGGLSEPAVLQVQ